MTAPVFFSRIAVTIVPIQKDRLWNNYLIYFWYS
jgi:hypothetical protein